MLYSKPFGKTFRPTRSKVMPYADRLHILASTSFGDRRHMKDSSLLEIPLLSKYANPGMTRMHVCAPQ